MSYARFRDSPRPIIPRETWVGSALSKFKIACKRIRPVILFVVPILRKNITSSSLKDVKRRMLGQRSFEYG